MTTWLGQKRDWKSSAYASFQPSPQPLESGVLAHTREVSLWRCCGLRFRSWEKTRFLCQKHDSLSIMCSNLPGFARGRDADKSCQGFSSKA